MAVVTVDSAKGGVGKTTLAVNFAVELAFKGVRAAVLDCDLNQHATQFGAVFCKRNPDLPIRFYPRVRAHNVVARIKEAEAEADVVIIDLPAGTSDLQLKALAKSQLVVIPAQKTAFDVRDATRTARQVAEAEDMTGVRIHSVLVWSRVQARKETITEREVRERFLNMITDPEGTVLPAPLLEYDAYPAGFVHGWVPSQVAGLAGKEVDAPAPGGGTRKVRIPGSAAKAAENMEALSRQILGRLTAIARREEVSTIRLKPNYEEILKRIEEEMAEGVE